MHCSLIFVTLEVVIGRIIKNAMWVIYAQSFSKVIAFVSTIYLARVLGVADFGVYIAALAYFSLFSVISDFGFNRFLIREGAKYENSLSLHLSSVILLRLALSSFLFAVACLGLLWWDQDVKRASLSMLAILAILPQSIALSVDSVFVAKSLLKYSALGLISLSLSSFFLSIGFVFFGWGSVGAVLALIISQLIYAAFLLFHLRSLHVSLFSAVSWEKVRIIVIDSAPYALLGILGLLYFRIDTLLLSYMKGAEQTGIYGASYRFLEAIVFIPSALATSLFPVLARLHESDSKAVKWLYFKSLKILFAISLIITLGFLVVLPLVVRFLLPSYIQALESIRILALTIPFLFLHVPAGIVLLSTHRYLKAVISLSFLTLSFNIIGNLLVIPSYGYIGASWMTVASEAFAFLVFYLFVQRRVFKA